MVRGSLLALLGNLRPDYTLSRGRENESKRPTNPYQSELQMCSWPIGLRWLVHAAR